MKAFSLASFILFLFCASGMAQENYIEVGKPLPAFTLEEVHHFPKKRVSLDDFKGRWLVLDFFGTGCVSCFESLPKINEFRKYFKGKVEFIMVGKSDKYIRNVYEKYRIKRSLELPVAYDTLLFKTFDIASVPYVVLLDDKGVVKAVTVSLSKENIQDFLDGKPSLVAKVANLREQEERKRFYNARKPLLVNGNGGADTNFLYRSLLAKWDERLIAGNIQNLNSLVYNVYGHIQVTGLPLIYLYDLAYGDTAFRWIDSRGSSYGKWWRKPVLEVSDSSHFQYDYLTNKNLYSYSMTVPREKVNGQYLKRVMQRDLETYFGYDVTVETRMMPCWYLVATKESKDKLKTKGQSWTRESMDDWTKKTGKSYQAFTGIYIKNMPVSRLVEQLSIHFQAAGGHPPFIDSTSIEGNIDIEVDTIMFDFEAVRKVLNTYGLDLVKGEKEMKVIVISDQKG